MSIYSNEKEQIVDDIQYLEYLIEIEKQDIKTRISQRIVADSPTTEQVENIADELSAILAQFSARISVIEKTLVNDNTEKNLIYPITTGAVAVDAATFQNDEVKISIVDIGKSNGLGILHHTENNIPFHYAVPNSIINFQFDIDRGKKKTLAIDLVEISEPALLDAVTINVDGKIIKYKHREIEGTTRLLCYLPIKSNGSTVVKIHVPQELKNSNKLFKFCISDVHCVPKLTLAKLASGLLK